MADKKVDATTGEVQEKGPNLMDETVPAEEAGVGPIKILKVHCKPVYNYQSVEFDWPIVTGVTLERDLAEMEWYYSKMLEILVRVSQNAPQVEAKKPVAPVEELASEKQKEILRNFHIDFKPDITKKQAHALIKKSMDQEIF